MKRPYIRFGLLAVSAMCAGAAGAQDLAGSSWKLVEIQSMEDGGDATPSDQAAYTLEFTADGTRIVQVLYNLLSNAARFSPPGGEIRLSVAHRGDRILFVIEDEGPGLTDELRSAILTRLDAPQAGGRQRGAGLGLSIVRTFVNLHGGTITAEQRDPRGSRITVNLPHDSALAGVAE